MLQLEESICYCPTLKKEFSKQTKECAEVKKGASESGVLPLPLTLQVQTFNHTKRQQKGCVTLTQSVGQKGSQEYTIFLVTLIFGMQWLIATQGDTQGDRDRNSCQSAGRDNNQSGNCGQKSLSNQQAVGLVGTTRLSLANTQFYDEAMCSQRPSPRGKKYSFFSFLLKGPCPPFPF